jgi:hypothetical protein
VVGVLAGRLDAWRRVPHDRGVLITPRDQASSEAGEAVSIISGFKAGQTRPATTKIGQGRHEF